MACAARKEPRKIGDKVAALALGALLSFPSAPAAAQDAFGGFIHNVRGGVLAHDRGAFSSNTEDGVDINLEIQFAEPEWQAWDYIFSPRPIIGGNINTVGDTSRGYAGLYWDYYPIDWLFVGGAVGGTIHDGELEESEPDRRALGSRVLFHLAVEVGVRFGETHGLSLYADHASNAGLVDDNESIEAAGIRYTFFFGGR
ncbi:MAG: acyloxyacyl hydrolase [Alphaproteobacteria bacterium]|nr:acyloxyacyl hydrolase [Alphaproteobacteria bacterium]